MARTATSAPSWLVVVLATCSGVAGLCYEVIWTQQLGVGLGHELVAVLAVLAAFFAGLALGALAFSRVIERSLQPARWYCACELAIAGWAWLLSAGMPRAAQTLASCIGAQPSTRWHWSVAFVGTLLWLLPATVAMGASLPALERTLASGDGKRSVIGGLYAANTLGAVLGVLGCTFLLVPRLGLAHSTRVCVSLNLACAVGAWVLGPKPEAASRSQSADTSARGPLLLLFTTGVFALGYEVLVVRVLSQVNENTVYTFAILLAVYLLGTALGGAAQQRWLGDSISQGYLRKHRDRLCLLTGFVCLCSSLSLWLAEPIKVAVTAGLLPRLGPMAAAFAAEAAVAAAAFLLPTLSMGVLFNQLCVEAKQTRLGLGRAFAANTLGAAMAPILFGVLLIPGFGAKPSLLVVSFGYLLLSARSVRLASGALAVAACALLAFVTAPPLVLVSIPAGGKLVRYEEGVTAAVSVIEDAAGVRTLRINNRQQEGSDATLLSDARQAWLPLLLHPRPRRALFLGLGTGLTAGAATWDPALQVTAVELLPEVAHAATEFAPVLHSERSAEIVLSDARRFVRSPGPSYDVIVADLFHPARSGSGALYTVEHFAAVRSRLAAHGLFCQWLPVHQLDLATLQSIVRSFVTVYPDATALLASNSLETPVLGLIARPGAPKFALSAVQDRVTALERPARLGSLRLADALAVLGSFVADARALQHFATGAPANTDDRPVVAQRAPFFTYAPDSPVPERLLRLLKTLSVAPENIVTDPPAQQARLADYWRARDRFVELGQHVRPTSDPSAMLAQVGEPLLTVLRTSPDFRPAYDPLLTMARAISTRDPERARSVLLQLTAAQPARSEAASLLAQLQPSPQP